jgi:hypothetical protein
MGILGTWIVVAPIAWGLYKCSVLAQRPTTNRKSVYALAAMLAAWLVLLIVVMGPGVPEGGAQLLLGAGLLFTGIPITAIVLAVLGLREISRSKRTDGRRHGASHVQGTWQAIGALLLASALLVPFIVYAGAHFFARGRVDHFRAE